MHPIKSLLIEIFLYRKTLLVIAIPIVFLPIPLIYPDIKGRCAYVVLWMCSYWTTEALPLAIAGLLPCVIMPLMSIVKIEDLAMEYIKDTSLLFFGGLILAMGIEKCNLHKRVAMSVLMVAGASARRVALGFMGTAWFLSMWMNNTATTTMMVPLVRAIIVQLKLQNEKKEFSTDIVQTLQNRESRPNFKHKQENEFHGNRESPERQKYFYHQPHRASMTPETKEIQKFPPSLFEERFLDPQQQNQPSKHNPLGLLQRRETPPSNQIKRNEKLQASHVVQENISQQEDPQDEPQPDPEEDRRRKTSPTRQPPSPWDTNDLFQRNNNNIFNMKRHFLSMISKRSTQSDSNRSGKMANQRPVSVGDPDLEDVKGRRSLGLGLQKKNIPEIASSNIIVSIEESYFENCISNLTRCLLCGVAYSSSIGGTASLIGTSPNLILKGQVTNTMGADVLTFTKWLLLALPMSLVIFIFEWMWLVYYFLGKNEFLRIFGIHRGDPFMEVLGAETIKKQYTKLGKMSYAEKNVAALFILLIFLWVSRDPGFIKGWGRYFKDKYVSDTQASLLVAFLLFIMPSKNLLEVYKLNKNKTLKERKIVRPLMDWSSFSSKMPWDILFLLGGGFALAKAIQVSELDRSVASVFQYFAHLPSWVLIIVLCMFTAITTEIASNVATATIYLPIVSFLANSLNISPLYLMIPICLTCSFSFMLPVGTPPNSIAYSFGNMEVLDMLKVGSVVSLFSQFVIHIFLNTWMSWILDMNASPAVNTTSGR